MAKGNSSAITGLVPNIQEDIKEAFGADVVIGGVTPGNTVKVYADEPIEKDKSLHGFDFSRVEKERIYTLREAAEVVGMNYHQLWEAVNRGSVRAVRSTWNERHLYVTGAELKRVMREEFVPAN